MTGKSARYTAEEWKTRVELAGCYRILAKLGMTDLTGTHVSAMIPGTVDQFLLNPYGLLFDEITASSLIRLDLDGKVYERSKFGLNPAGYPIHGAIHRARPDAKCVLHAHTRAGMVMGALDCQLLPVNQASLLFYEQIGYTDYAWIDNIEQCDKLVQDLGENLGVIMRNHGLLTVGRSIGEALAAMYKLNMACEIQIAAMATGQPLRMPPPEVCRDAARGWKDDESYGPRAFAGLMRRLDAEDRSYRR
jgi:ribulose-5-phosphate 4-epimerase/fuculose-1-phosphate aldolase